MPTSESLMSTAIDHADFWKATVPMTLRGTIVFMQNGKAINASYELIFISSSRWREEVRFANYSRIRVGNGGSYSQSMPDNYQPVFMFWLDRMMHLPKALSLGPKDILGKIHEAHKNSVRVLCSAVSSLNRSSERTICIDPGAGTVVEIEYPTHTNSNPPEIDRIQYSDFRKQGDKMIPFHVESSKSGKPVLTLQITEISSDVPPESTLPLNVPAGSTLWASCGTVKTPELATKIAPVYPSAARTSHQSGNVILYAIVETDGSISNPRVLQSASTMLDAAAIDAVRQWKYTPVSCDGVPVRVETSIEINFYLNY
jgi:TonB family protein